MKQTENDNELLWPGRLAFSQLVSCDAAVMDDGDGDARPTTRQVVRVEFGAN